MTGSGADRDRTDDIQLAKLALSQLSYSPETSGGGAMGLGGLEPPTSRLSGARSSQLSYRPVVWPVGSHFQELPGNGPHPIHDSPVSKSEQEALF